MRRALATTALAAGIALAGAPFAAPALADDAPSTTVVASSVDSDEPLEKDKDDDTGKYGVIGLSGLLGLFGYKKYKEHRAHRATTTTTRQQTSGPIGGIDEDGSGSRRV